MTAEEKLKLTEAELIRTKEMIEKLEVLIEDLRKPHTDRSQRCPKCGFRVVIEERIPFVIEDDNE